MAMTGVEPLHTYYNYYLDRVLVGHSWRITDDPENQSMVLWIDRYRAGRGFRITVSEGPDAMKEMKMKLALAGFNV